LESYLIGKLRPYVNKPPQGCRMSIVQPKTNPVIRYQCSTRPEDNLTVKGIMSKAIDLHRAAVATDDPDAPCVSGKHCQWCKANPKRGGHCTAAAEQGLEVVKSMSNDLVIENGGSLFEVMSQMVKDTSSLTNEQLAQFADAKDPMVAAFVKVEEEIQARLEVGQQVSGYAMLPSNSSYVWNSDAKEIEKALKGRRLKLADIYPPKLISPAQMKKLPASKLTPAQKERLAKDLISEKIGKLVLRKVARKEKESAEQLFAGVQKPLEEISFL